MAIVGAMLLVLFSLLPCSTAESCATSCSCNTQGQQGTQSYQKIVDCSNLALTTVPATIPIDSTELNLRNNRISQLDTSILRRLIKLKKINLSQNNLQTLPNDVFNFNTALLEIDLSGNPLLCDCRLFGVHNTSQHISKFAATCTNPPTLSGKSLRSLMLYQFCGGCAGLKASGGATRDGEYAIKLKAKCEGYARVYCHGMNTDSPQEYISLLSGPRKNYAYIHDYKQPEYNKTVCKRVSGGSIYSQSGLTNFTKVRISLTSQSVFIKADDFQFSTKVGNKNVEYGVAGDCYSASHENCRKGRFEIDLTGTGFILKDGVYWQHVGSPSDIKNTLDIDEERRRAYGECGGYCGQCRPQGSIDLELDICLDEGVKPCFNPFGMDARRIPDSRITASSYRSGSLPQYGRLNNIKTQSTGGSWCAEKSDGNQYLQVDLGKIMTVSGIATQGAGDQPSWVTKYKLMRSDDGSYFEDHAEFGITKTFIGNKDNFNVATNWLSQRFRARYIRIVPMEWKNAICLRAELYGCENDIYSSAVRYQQDKRCWSPMTSSSSCNLDDGTLLALSPHCQRSDVMISFNKDRTIRHTCSGKCVFVDSNNFLALRDEPCDFFSKVTKSGGAIAIRHDKTGSCVKLDDAKKNQLALASCRQETLFELSQKGLSPLRPSITIKKVHYLAVDKPAWIDCKVIADPRAQVFWTKSRPWPNEQGQLSKLEFLEFSNGSLYVRKARMSYSGQYYCTAANSAAFEIGSFQIRVGAPPSFTKVPVNSSAVINKTAQLHCAATSNLLTVITWYKREIGSAVLTSVDKLDDRFLVFSNMSLQINRAQEMDEAFYVCVAKNPVGTQTSEAFLKVKVPPSFSILPKDQDVPMTSDLLIICKTLGDPRPVITWSKKGSPNGLPKNFKVYPSGSLHVRGITKADQGRYICRAASSVGSAAAEISIKVHTACRIDSIPFASHQPDQVFFRVDSMAQVTCNLGYHTTDGVSVNMTCEDDGNFNRSMPKCRDINECRVSPSSDNDHDVQTFHDCHKHALCINTKGSYRCECGAGYQGDGKICTPVCGSPKLPYKGKRWMPKRNYYDIGSTVTLECETGYSADSATLTCSAAIDWSGGALACSDVDECSKGVSGKSGSACTEHANCKNTVGSYTCRCIEGYEGDGFTSCKVKKEREVEDSTGKKWKFTPKMDDLMRTLKDFEAKNKSSVEVLEVLHNTTGPQTAELSAGDVVASVTTLRTLLKNLKESGSPKTKEELEIAIDVCSNLLNENNKEQWQEIQKDSAGVSEVMTILEEYARVFGGDVVTTKSNGSMAITTDNIVMKIEARKARSLYDGQSFPSNPDERNAWKDDRIETQIRVPGEVFQDYKSGLQIVQITNVVYKGLGKLLPTRAEDAKRFDVDSQIVAVSLNPPAQMRNGKMAAPLSVTLGSGDKRPKMEFVVKCVFWDFEKDKSHGGAWSTEGCRLVSSSSNGTICECDHMTSFASIAVYDKELVFSIYVYIGCGILLLCVLILFVRHLYIHCKRNAERSIVHINLCVAIAAGVGLFLGALKLTKMKIVCIVIAALLQYFFMAMFCWMIVEGLQLYMVLASGKNKNRARRKWFFIIGWGLPVIAVGVSLGVFQLKGYGNKEWCWLDYSDLLMWAFAGPAAAFFLVLFIFVIMIACVKGRVVDSSDRSRISVSMTFMVLCTILIGGTWVAAAIYVKNHQDNVIWEYVFAGACVLQGIMILLFGILDREIKNFSYLYSIKKMQQKEHKEKRNYYSTTDTVQYYGGANAPDGKNYTVTRPSAKESTTDLRGSSKRLSRIASTHAVDETDEYPSPMMDTPVFMDNSLQRKIENNPMPYTPSYPNSEVIQLQTFPVRKATSEAHSQFSARDRRPDGAEEPDSSPLGDHRSTTTRSISMPRSIDSISNHSKLEQIPERAPLLRGYRDPASAAETTGSECSSRPEEMKPRYPESPEENAEEDTPLDPSRRRSNRSRRRLEDRFGKSDRDSISQRKRKLRYSSGYLIGATIETDDGEKVDKEHASL